MRKPGAPTLSATICRSISPRRLLLRRRFESTYMPRRISFAGRCRLAAVGAALSLGLAAGAVRADEYSDINQLLRGGKAAEALARAEAGLAKNARDPQLRFLQAVALTNVGKTEDAVAAFRKLIEDYPELPEPYNNLAVIYAGQGQLENARGALELAVRNNPEYALAYENLADVYVRLAYQNYNKSVALDARMGRTVNPKLTLVRELLKPPVAPASGTK